MTGGTKPYSVSLIAFNNPGFTNITMGPYDDILVWPDYLAPGSQFIGEEEPDHTKRRGSDYFFY